MLCFSAAPCVLCVLCVPQVCELVEGELGMTCMPLTVTPNVTARDAALPGSGGVLPLVAAATSPAGAAAGHPGATEVRGSSEQHSTGPVRHTGTCVRTLRASCPTLVLLRLAEALPATACTQWLPASDGAQYPTMNH